MTQLEQNLQTELDSLAQTLSQRIKTLSQRYAEPLPTLTKQVDKLSEKVSEHLANMGFVL
jgi:type I restriction enzyme M protein